MNSMAFDPTKGYVPLPPNQNHSMVDPHYKKECNAILNYLLDGSNTNNGVWFYENIQSTFPNIPTTTLDRVIFPKLKIDDNINIIDGIYAPSSTTRVQFRISDKGKLFITNGGYVDNPKSMKDFVYELLDLLDEKAMTVDVSDFVINFQKANSIDRVTIKFKIDELVRDKFIVSMGHQFLANSGGLLSNEKPFIHAAITAVGQSYFQTLRNVKRNIEDDNTTKTTSKFHPNDDSVKNTEMKKDYSKVFIVHGHDDLATSEVARFVEKLEFEPIILREQASLGKTIIEKIEEYSYVGFGIVLYTPCDLGAAKKDKNNLQPRARQNVVFEHGYLIGKLGRSNVCALVKDELEKPTDISGVVYVTMDTHMGWRMIVAKEMKASGYTVDMNKLVD
jgi:predicted nucleotide-binding protein